MPKGYTTRDGQLVPTRPTRMPWRPVKLSGGNQVHPIVRLLHDRQNELQIPTKVLAAKSGVSENAICEWKKGNSPRLALVECVAQVLGLRVVLQPIEGSEP